MTRHHEITYKITGIKPEDLLSAFRNSYNPRIAVTVDMIATGTDVKPLEIVMFMRDVQEPQLLRADEGARLAGHRPDRPPGRHARRRRRRPTSSSSTPSGVTASRSTTDSPPLDRQPTVPFDKLLQAVGMGSTEPDVVSTLASRLARLDRQLSPGRARLPGGGRGRPLTDADPAWSTRWTRIRWRPSAASSAASEQPTDGADRAGRRKRCARRP